MAATLSRIVFDRLGEPQRIIHPTFDQELNNPAHTGSSHVDVQQFNYQGIGTKRDILVLIQPMVADAGHPVLANLIGQRIAMIDAVVQAQADIDARNTLIETFPSPTPGQQLAINAATLKAIRSISAAQDIRDAIAIIVAQLP